MVWSHSWSHPALLVLRQQRLEARVVAEGVVEWVYAIIRERPKRRNRLLSFQLANHLFVITREDGTEMIEGIDKR